GSTATEGIHRSVERVLRQALLHQHRQAHGTLSHVGHTAGKVNPAARRQRDHQSFSALRTRRKARPSTAASTRTKTPLGSAISDRRPRKAYTDPSNGFSARLCCTSIAKPTAPFRMSVTPQAR